ncbi:thioesterase family protein [Pseudonocardia humida]|uniref:Thioesterase family protein n=1 Tax=Pseudonocardia humida TaxID=2800819 RepID=A0ABT1A199_9PSEU|nr:thioesterase family protein [Pseudonocardia humida]MCO1656785.1 thioesterase family protein [Pseudonocardia humida]
MTTEARVDDPPAAPFRAAVALQPLGDGRYSAELGRHWTVGPKAHGGLLMALMARAGLAAVEDAAPGVAPDPLAVAADFLRAPDPGPVELSTEVLKTGRTVSVVAVRLVQSGRSMLAATVTAGRLPDVAPSWTDLPDLPPEPPDGARDASLGRGGEGLGAACDLWFDRSTMAFTRHEQGPPVLRGWVRPRGEPVDALFAMVAGDILPPTVFNLGTDFGWAPTVQLTALLRARPAPGWLRLEARSASVTRPWFDEDVLVIDSAGRLVCQTRQLALAPLPPS